MMATPDLATDVDLSFCLRSIRSCVVNYPIRPQRVITSCAGRHATSLYLGVRVTDETGAVGYGEAATVPIWSGEHAAGAAVLLEQVIAPNLLNQAMKSPAAALDVMDRVLIANPFLKAAVDTAIWDMLGRRAGLPITQLIADRTPIRSIPVRGGISAHEVDQVVDQARGFIELGIQTLKLKTGLGHEMDRRRLEALRNTYGDSIALTIDYNGGLTTLESAVTAIEALLPFRLALVEQPMSRDRLSLLAQVRRQVDVPIMADEGIFTPAQLQEAIGMEALDLLSLYPGKNGGFTNSLKMAKQAQSAGIPCLIGSNLETDVGMAAMGCLAASLEAFAVPQYASDLASSLFYQDATAIDAQPIREGCYPVPDGPGFGVCPVWHDRAE